MFSGFGMHSIVSTSTSRSFGQDLVSFSKSQITFLLLGSTKSGEFLDQLSSYQLLKKLYYVEVITYSVNLISGKNLYQRF
jgi:hypothetical protein